MVNPDGVMLSQQGLSSIAPDDSVLRQRLIDYNEGSTDFLRWKANLNGVDLNLNFDAGWKKDHYFSSPNYYRYAGGSPFDQPESQMLRDITLKYNFDLSVSYHTSGQIIFWYYDQGADAVNRDSAITDQLSAITSYRPVKSSTSNAMWGGYKDWYIQELNNPGFTLEVGPSSASSPLDVRYFDKIWQDNQYVPIYLAYRESR